MTAESRSKAFRQSLTWGKRLAIVAVVMTGLSWGVLEMVEKSKNPIRLGIEDYLKQETGQNAEITSLSEMSLTPDAFFDMEGILVRDKTQSDKILISVKRVKLGMPFWHLLVGRGFFHVFEATNMEVATGFWLPKKLTVRFAGISDPTPEKASPNFVIDGEYNARDLLITAEMRRKNGKKPLYGFHSRFPVTFKLGDLEGSGSFVRGLTKVTMEEAVLTRSGHEAAFTVDELRFDPLVLRASGTVDGVPFNALLTKEGDIRVLRITPEGADPQGLRSIGAFVDLIRADLGLTEKDKALTITIDQPAIPASKDSDGK